MSALAQIPYGRPSAWASASPFLDGGFLRAEKHKNSRAHDGKLILCKHIMVSHTCLSKLLSGVISAEQALADPQEVLSQCGCTTIWDVNRWIRAENRGARLRSPSGNDPTRLRSSHISQYLKADPRSLVSSTKHLKRNLLATSCLRTLLMAPASSISDVPLNEFFSKRRVSEALEGIKVPMCRHTRFSDGYVSGSFVPNDRTIDRKCCGKDLACACYKNSGTTWGHLHNRCHDPACGVEFTFIVAHGTWERPDYPPSPCEALGIFVKTTFEDLESGTHPSWRGSITLPHEIGPLADAYEVAGAHHANTLFSNYQWFDQAIIDTSYHRARTAVLEYCPRAVDHLAFLAKPPRCEAEDDEEQSLPTERSAKNMSDAEDAPPPYSSF
jgi:hypothetical protein